MFAGPFNWGAKQSGSSKLESSGRHGQRVESPLRSQPTTLSWQSGSTAVRTAIGGRRSPSSPDRTKNSREPANCGHWLRQSHAVQLFGQQELGSCTETSSINGWGHRIPGGQGRLAKWYGEYQYVYYRLNENWRLGTRIEMVPRSGRNTRRPDCSPSRTPTAAAAARQLRLLTVGVNWLPTSNVMILGPNSGAGQLHRLREPI